MNRAVNIDVEAVMRGNDIPGAGPAPVRRAGQVARAAVAPFRWLARAYRARRAARHLRELSDRQLRDIGIARHEIDMVVRDRLRRRGDSALGPVKPRSWPERPIKRRARVTATTADDTRERIAA